MGFNDSSILINFNYAVPQIVRRKKTLEAVDDDLRRAFSTKVVLTTTGGETCSTMVGRFF